MEPIRKFNIPNMNILQKLAMVFAPCLVTACALHTQVQVKETMQVVQQHLGAMAQSVSSLSTYPRTVKNGALVTVPSRDWTSGFFPGSLWLMYEYTKDQKWETLARNWNAALEKEKFNKTTHDLGFMMFCSFGNGYRLTKDPRYRDILVQSSKSLISRFNENTGTIRSWDHNRDKWQFPVIIDNMMNLEMLFWATKITGDSVYYRVANTHALTTLKNHFRPDNSSYHVVDYDTTGGQVRKRQTHQGYADESAWARGQAWGLYGFTVTYRETRNKKFLEQAQKIADFFIGHPNLPADKIPYWDFNAPNIPDVPRDASAAAIAASGLLELSQYSGEKGKVYRKAAVHILNSLASPAYLAKPGNNHHFILMHSTGHLPGGSEIDVPLVYADYYFMEGLLRLGAGGLAKGSGGQELLKPEM